MKILIYSDLQATEGHERLYADPSVSLQTWRVDNFYDWLRELYFEEGCDAVWDLGDTTDDRTAIPIPTLDIVARFANEIPASSNNIKLVGNHEQFLKNAQVHACGIFGNRFKVVDTFEVFHVDGLKVVCAAFPSSDEELANKLLETAAEEHDGPVVLLGHFQVSGAAMRSGRSTTGVPMAAFRDYDLTLLGHVHKPQALTRKAHYVGSPFQQNFGESGEQKRVGILDTKTLDIQWVPVDFLPEYKEVSFDTWVAEVDPDNEHRYRVILSSPEETEAFYNHMMSGRAVPTYAYVQEAQHDDASGEEETPTERDDVIRAYVDRHPPTATGLMVGTTELLEIGLDIANG